MISLDQVYLLEEKVESAVAKIQQLQAENDALRRQCSELKNALSSKTEQLNTFSVDQNQIEEGIRKALDRLNSIENQVLKQVDQVSFAPASNQAEVNSNAAVVDTIIATPIPTYTNPVEPQIKTPVQEVQPQTEEELAIKESFSIESEPVQEEVIEETFAPSFTDMSEIKSKTEMDLSQQFTEDSDFSEPDLSDEEEENPDGLGFDIF